MATVELTRENFDRIVVESDTVLIDFRASWCAPCRTFEPVYERVAARHRDVVFGTVDTDAQPELAAAFQVTSVPTLAVVRDQIVLYAQPGALPEAALEELVGQAREVDMDEVRRTMAHGAGWT